eukprot:scaffold24740_cov66-Attheya_sp.AAC.5
MQKKSKRSVFFCSYLPVCRRDIVVMNIWKSFAILACVVIAAKRFSSKEDDKPKRSDRIAVIGGGVHGLFMARALKLGGYSNVVVFEKENALAASTETFEADSQSFDYATKFIPADTTAGPGIPSELKTMIETYGLTTRPYTAAIQNYFYQEQLVSPLPEVLLPYVQSEEGRQQLISDIFGGFELMKMSFAVAKTPLSLIETGFVKKDETWSDFAERINLPAFTDYAEFLANTFLNGPVRDQPAAIVLNGRNVFMPSYVKSVLQALGIGGDTTLPISNELRSLLASPFPGSSFVINEGYQTFFEKLVETEGIDVCMGCEITKIKANKKDAGSGVSLYTRGTKQDFDHVIISSRPHDSLKLFHGPSALKDLVSSASDFNPVFVLAFRTDSTPSILAESFAAIIYPASSNFNDVPDGTISAVTKDFADSNVCVAIAYSDFETSDEEAITKAALELEDYKFQFSEVIGYRKYSYVSVPTAEEVANDWLTKMNDLQGVDNIYTIGEALSGYGVPVSLNFVNDLYKEHFAT